MTTRGRADTGLFMNGPSRNREGSGRETAEMPRAADALLSRPEEFLSQLPERSGTRPKKALRTTVFPGEGNRIPTRVLGEGMGQK